MKKIYTYIYSAVLAAALVLSGCTVYEEEVSAPFVLPFEEIKTDGKWGHIQYVDFSHYAKGNCEFYFECSDSWVQIEKLKPTYWVIRILKNETISRRETTILVTAKDNGYGGATYSQTIKVEQSEGEATASVDSVIEFTADADYRTYSLDTNLPNYTISCDADWVTVGKNSESGSRIFIRVKANPESYSRRATLSIKGSGYTIENVATIYQSGMNYQWEEMWSSDYTVESGNEINLNVSPYGVENISVGIRTNLSWKCEVYEYTGGTDWVMVHTPSCTVETKTEAEATYFKFSIAENRRGPRHLMLKVYAERDENKCTYIIISQTYIPHVSFQQEQITIDSSAKEYSVSFKAEANWYATCDADWLTITRSSGGGNEDQLTFAVTENTSEPKRTATIKLGLTDWVKDSVEMTVVQTCKGALYYTQKEGTTTPITLGGSEPFDVPIAEHYYDPTTCEGGITFEGTPTKIGELAFANSQLTSITLPNTIKEIGYEAFANSQLKEITLHEGLEVIDGFVFSGCKISSINIPSSVRYIESAAFSNTHLKSVHITDLSAWCQIEYGNNYAANPLYGGGKLYLNGEPITELIIPSDVTCIKKGAFQYFTALESVIIHDGVTEIDDYAFGECTNLKSVSLGNGVQKIGWVAFGNCESLPSITIPDSVNQIESGAFHSCKSLQAFNGKFTSSDNRCLIVNGTLIAFAPNGVTICTIPDGVITIGEYAFMYCTDLTSVVIPEGVKIIQEDAFAYCDNLAGVNLPESLTAIDRHAFAGCHGLTDVTIPDGVKYISGFAFDYCRELRTVTIGSGVEEIGNGAFRRCYKLEEANCKAINPPILYDSNIFEEASANLTIYVPTASVEAYKKAEYWSNNASQIVGKEF